MAQPGEFNISLYKGTLETVDISRNLANEKNVLSIRMLSGEYQTERKAEVRRGAKRQAEGGDGSRETWSNGFSREETLYRINKQMLCAG